VQTTGIIGSPLYMAPEQMQSSRDVDVRCDVWALGVILYELVTGKPPFRAESMPELVLRVVQGGPPQPLRELRPSVPAELESVVGKCLARDRAQRFEHVAELARALGPFGSEKARFSVERIVGVLSGAGAASRSLPTPSSSPPPPPVPSSLSGDDVPGAARATADSWGKTARPVARSRRLALAALAAAGTFGFVAWRATRTAGKASLDSEPAVRAPADGAFAAFTPEPKPSAAVAVSSSAAASVAEVQSAPPSASGSTSSAPRPRAAIAAVATAARPVRAAHSRSSAGAEPASIFDDRK
jgi:serine/threonine-protein kinase